MKILKECGLSITTETKQKAVDFLDIQLYLLKTIYGTYRRPNDDPMNKNIKLYVQNKCLPSRCYQQRKQ